MAIETYLLSVTANVCNPLGHWLKASRLALPQSFTCCIPLKFPVATISSSFWVPITQTRDWWRDRWRDLAPWSSMDSERNRGWEYLAEISANCKRSSPGWGETWKKLINRVPGEDKEFLDSNEIIQHGDGGWQRTSGLERTGLIN